MFKIGDFSRLTQVPVSTLRYYAELGLLEPAHTDPHSGYRYYTVDQLPRLNRILALKDLGLSLDEIAHLLGEGLPPSELRGMLRLKQAELHQEMGEMQARLRRVEARLQHIEKEGKMPAQEVVLKPLDSVEGLAVRLVVPTPEHVGMLIGESAAAIMQNGLPFSGAPFIIFHDREFKPADLDVEAVFPVGSFPAAPIPMAEGRQLARTRLPAVETAAITLHAGDYANFPQTYESLGRWMEANQYQIAGPVREVYLRAPSEEGGALAEIQIPVAHA